MYSFRRSKLFQFGFSSLSKKRRWSRSRGGSLTIFDNSEIEISNMDFIVSSSCSMLSERAELKLGKVFLHCGNDCTVTFEQLDVVTERVITKTLWKLLGGVLESLLKSQLENKISQFWVKYTNLLKRDAINY